MTMTRSRTQADPFNVACPSQDILALIGSKWSMLVLCALRPGAMRTGELKRRLAGVSAKMLTQTLRELERHGIVVRDDFGEVPPRVEYELSSLGRSLSDLVVGIEQWVTTHYSRMTRVTRSFDADPRPARGSPARRS
jgi:DNA-binding HxlR family transcriptional regulator